jgi:hypothetical protein
MVRGEVASFDSEFYITECTWMRKHGWRTPQWKLIVALEPDFHFKPKVELYNLIEDPHEDRSVVEENPAIVKLLRSRMEAWIAKREAETGTKNPMLLQGDWHGHKGLGAFKTSQQAYDTLHIGNVGAAQRLQAKNKYAARGEHHPASEAEDAAQLITIIGRGHGGTRAMSHTLSHSGIYMGNTLNGSGDLLPPEQMYEACRVMSKHVVYKGNMQWNFSKLHTMPIDPEFEKLIKSYLKAVLDSPAARKGWKIPETTLCLPWIVRMFPQAYYIQWMRDPRDSILSGHVTDNLEQFGIPSGHAVPPRSLRLRRAISWQYQAQLIRATPKPAHWLSVRFEDFVLDQDATLKKLSDFLGFPLAKIAVDPAAVGRWKQDKEEHDFDFLQAEMKEYGYLAAAAADAAKGKPRAKPRARRRAHATAAG